MPEPVSVRRATVMLLLVTLFWGLSFPMVKAWQNAAGDCPGGSLIATLTLIAVRFVLSLALLAVAQPRLFTMPTRQEYGWGSLLGLSFLVGFVFQVWGMARTTPAMSAFITSLGSTWVPLLGWLVFRTRVAALTLAGLAVGVAGTAVLSLGEEGGWDLQGGESMTVIASVMFAVQILLLDCAGRRVNADRLSAGFFSCNAVVSVAAVLAAALAGPGLAAWWDWMLTMLGGQGTIQAEHGAFTFPLAAAVGLLVLFPTVLAFHWMNVFQPHVPASRAALIYLLEPVFAGAFSIALGMNQLTTFLLLGGGMILMGNLVVELSGWQKEQPASLPAA